MTNQSLSHNQGRPTKQEDYTWGTPCLIVSNVEKAIDTYTTVLGFTIDLNKSMKDKTGTVNWAKLTYKDFGLHLYNPKNALCESTLSTGKGQSPKALGITSPVSFYLYNDNVEDLLTKAKAHGLQIIQEPEVMFWGDQMCTLLDQDNYLWNIAKNVADFDPSKMPS